MINRIKTVMINFIFYFGISNLNNFFFLYKINKKMGADITTLKDNELLKTLYLDYCTDEMINKSNTKKYIREIFETLEIPQHLEIDV